MSKNKKYYVGLDIGTSSVGWAVTDESYNLLKVRGKKTIGVRLFDEASTSEERRNHRSTRRRLERRRRRLTLLEQLFAEEIAKVDMAFFQRLKESKYVREDKTVDSINILFNDLEFGDKEFYKKYPTIYHLRSELMTKENPDIREIFLACHHILKYRGHFLNQGDNFSDNESLQLLLSSIKEEQSITEKFSEMLEDDKKLDEVEKILLNRDITRKDKSTAINKIFGKDKQADAFFKFVLGMKSDIDKIFANEDYKENNLNKISISEKIYDDIRADYEQLLKDDIALLDLGKQIYDAIILSSIKEVGLTLAESKVKSYDKHKDDLKVLKSLIKNDNLLTDTEKTELLNILFEDNVQDNYISYTGRNTLSKDGDGTIKKCVYADFKKFLEKNIFPRLEVNEQLLNVKKELELEKFLPLQKTKDNSVVPYQLHREELINILDNASKYYDFLNVKEDGYTVKEKIVRLLEFRIPYYVGPLNNYHEDKNGNAWVVRKSNEQITPWNFDEVIDSEQSAEKFIRRMTNKCTYLVGEDVLPKYSLLYSEFTLLNELNILTINGKRLDVEVRNKLINDLFVQNTKKVTKNRLVEYLKAEGLFLNDDTIGGIDEEIASNLNSYRDMKNILNDKFDVEMAEQIILWITLFGESKNLLESKITDKYGHILNVGQIKELAKLNYKGWGRLSEKLLTNIVSKMPEFVDKSTGECGNIISVMRNYPKNLMEVLSTDYDFKPQIEGYNIQFTNVDNGLTYDMLENVYVSPSVKRAVWQSLKIVDELTKEIGHEPEKIFVESVRSNKQEKKKKDSRKKAFEQLYNNIKDDTHNWKEEINSLDDSDFRRKKIYLYFAQQGRCMYSGARIDLHDLINDTHNKLYDIDHIYARSLTKDDSITRNLVLVDARLNKQKSDKMLFEVINDFKTGGGKPVDVQALKKHWKFLKDKKLITTEKYERLTRQTPLTQEELSRFIARQLVETSQSTKAVSTLLHALYPKTDICYVKAENVSDFRRQFSYEKDEKTNKSKVRHAEFMKIRDLNDYHHAHDAYLSIVVGNIFNTKFARNPYSSIKEPDDTSKYNLARMYDYNVANKSTTAWEVNKTINTVLNVMRYKWVLVSRKTIEGKGALYDATVYNKNRTKKDVYLSLKSADSKLSDVTKYGGVTKIKIAYYSIVSYDKTTKKGIEKMIRLIPIPIYLSNNIKTDNDILEYAKQTIGNDVDNKLDSLKLLYRKLNVGNEVIIDGHRYYIGGKTNNNVCIDRVVQLLIDIAYIPIVQEIYKYNLFKLKNKEVDISEFGKITEDNNLNLYNYLVDKMNTHLFIDSRNKKYLELNEEDREKWFRKLELIEQVETITEALDTIINVRKTTTMNITKLKEFKIVEKSTTGLREKIITII